MPNTQTLIASYTVAAARADIDFTGVPNTYTDLLIRASLRHNQNNGGEDTPFIRFNNDSGANYQDTYGNSRGTGVPSQSADNALSSFYCGTLPGVSDTSGSFSNIEIYIPNYANTSLNKTLYSESVTEAMYTSVYIRPMGGQWKSTAAINRVTFGIVSAGFSFDVNSSVYIYGILKP